MAELKNIAYLQTLLFLMYVYSVYMFCLCMQPVYMVGSDESVGLLGR